MFYLKDMSDGKLIGFETPQSLARHWTVKFGLNSFEELNVTGKDTINSVSYCGSTTTKDGLVLPIYKTVVCLRRYQVLDDTGRSIDIRTWPENYFTSKTKRRYTYFFTGYKRHHRRSSGPSLQMCLLRTSDPDMEGIMPVLNRTSLRKKAIMSVDDWYDYYRHDAERGYYKPRSWKNQTKSRHQWSRKRSKRPACLLFPESGEDLARRLTDELVKPA